MGTTPGGLRYPDPTDVLSDVPEYIQNLAEDADTVWAYLARSAVQSIPNATPTDVVWTPASSDLHPDFALITGNTQLEYNGTRTRWFVLNVTCIWPAQATGTRSVQADLIGTGRYINGHDAVDLAAVTGTANQNAVAGLFQLDPGDIVYLMLTQSTGSAKNAQPKLGIAALA